MAVVSLLGTPNFSTTSGAKTVTATPAAGDLIVICVMVSEDGTWSAPTDDNSSGTYSLIGSKIDGGHGEAGAIYVRNSLISSAASTVFTLSSPGGDTGGGLAVIKITGMAKAGSAAVRQSKQNSGGGTSAMSTGTWTNSRLSANPVIGFSVSGYTSGFYTAMSGFTLIVDSAYTSPFAVATAQKIDSGNTGNTMTWGGVTGAEYYWACIGAELDASQDNNMFLMF